MKAGEKFIIKSGAKDEKNRTQMAGAYASPIKFFGYSKTTPLGIQNKLNNYDAVANGIA